MMPAESWGSDVSVVGIAWDLLPNPPRVVVSFQDLLRCNFTLLTVA